MDQNLYRLVGQQKLSPAAVAEVYQLATEPGDVQQLERRLQQGAALVAGLLLGAALIFWIAANWQEQGRIFKLVLIEAALALSVLLAWLLPRARVAALLCASLALGGLLAYVGQTYQTGADAWQLFAAWAALSLIWTALARSDLLWTLWVMVVATGLTTWSGYRFGWDMLFQSYQSTIKLVSMLLWLLLALAPLGVSLLPWLHLQNAQTGDAKLGRWSHRVATGLALAVWATYGAFGWFEWRDGGWMMVLAAGLLVALVFRLAWSGRVQDFVVLCLAALAVNVLVLSGAARLAMNTRDLTGALFLFSLAALACLGGSAKGLFSVQQRMRLEARSAALTEEAS